MNRTHATEEIRKMRNTLQSVEQFPHAKTAAPDTVCFSVFLLISARCLVSLFECSSCCVHQGLTDRGPQAKSSPSPVSVNKVLLAHSHVVCYLLSTAAFALQRQSGTLPQRPLAQKPKYLVLHSKSLLALVDTTLLSLPPTRILPCCVSVFPCCYKCFASAVSDNCLACHCTVSLCPIVKHIVCLFPKVFDSYNEYISEYIWM